MPRTNTWEPLRSDMLTQSCLDLHPNALMYTDRTQDKIFLRCLLSNNHRKICKSGQYLSGQILIHFSRRINPSLIIQISLFKISNLSSILHFPLMFEPFQGLFKNSLKSLKKMSELVSLLEFEQILL